MAFVTAWCRDGNVNGLVCRLASGGANRARVVLRYANAKDLLISGLVDGGGEIAQHPAVLDVPFGQGHVVLFSINPVYRGETRGTYSLVLNTVLNFDNLNAGRKDAAK